MGYEFSYSKTKKTIKIWKRKENKKRKLIAKFEEELVIDTLLNLTEKSLAKGEKELKAIVEEVNDVNEDSREEISEVAESIEVPKEETGTTAVEETTEEDTPSEDIKEEEQEEIEISKVEIEDKEVE